MTRWARAAPDPQRRSPALVTAPAPSIGQDPPMPETTHASDIMSSPATAFSPDQDLLEAARTLFDNRWGGAPVVKDGKVVGVVTLADVVATHMDPHPPKVFVLFDALLYLGSKKRYDDELRKISAMTVGDAMTSPAISVTSNATVAEVAGAMVDKRLATIPVVDDGKLVGVIGRRDVVRLVLGRTAETE